MRRYLVTGGAGFIGSHLVDGLVAEGHEVVVLDDFSTGEEANLADAMATGRMRVVRGSVLNSAAIEEAAAGCDGVFHLAVQCVRRSIGDPVYNHHVNATGTLLTLEAARRHKVGRFLYCSSSEVYGSTSTGALDEDNTPCVPTTVYGGSKLAGELYTLAYLRTYHLPTLVVRPFNAYGPREHDRGDLAEVIPRFLIRILNGRAPIVFGDGSNARDFTYVMDTVRGLRLAMDCDTLVGQTVNLGHGRAISVREVADTLLRLLGRNDLSIDFAPARPGDVHRLMASTNKAREAIGFQPEVSFEDGLRRYIEWFRARHPNLEALLEDDIFNWRLPGGNSYSFAK